MALSRLEYLFECYVSCKCSIEEEKELMLLLAQPENEVMMQRLIDRVFETTESEVQMPHQVAASILQNILQRDNVPVVSIENKNTSRFPWMKVAAAVIFFVSGAVFWMLYKKEIVLKSNRVALAKNKPFAVPGGNHATLVMADGSSIILDSVKDGKIQNGNVKISKQNGLLVFNGQTSNSTEPVSYNKLTTPRGGQYKVILADGTSVWLNASSLLHFPTAFTGKQRDVELTGEAYFEVAKNKEKPFHVKVNGMRIEVLGTHFNVNAYPDEDAMRTSLLEGRVKMTKGAISGLLKPGQQGILKKNDNNVEIKDADMNEVMAWKNGLFQFSGADITSIMNQIGRWYDIDVVYAGKVPVRSFEGKISRDAQLSDVLQILELSNVKFTMEGKKIIVQ